MTVEKLNGYIVISEIINGYLEIKKYLYCSITEAKRDFKKTFYNK